MRTNRYCLATKINRLHINISSRCEPPFLVELFIIRKISLGNNTQQRTMLHHYSSIDYFSAQEQRHSNNSNDIQLTSIVEQLHQSHFGTIEQQLLLKQVATSVASNAQLRKSNNSDTFAFCNCHHILHLLDVILAVCDLDRRNCSSHFNKSVVHNLLFVFEIFIHSFGIENFVFIVLSTIN